MTADTVVVDVSQDWVGACEVQERFMEVPCAKTQTLMYSGRCRQMRSLGGDCFDFLPLPGRRVALTVADASGKGLPAALIMANVQSSLRTAALFAPDNVAAVVTAVNSQLHASSPANRYATLFYGVFDILWCFRRRNTDTRICERRPQSPDRNPQRRLNHLARGRRPARRSFCGYCLQGSGSVEPGRSDRCVHGRRGRGRKHRGRRVGSAGLLAAVAASQMRHPDRIVQAAFTALDFSGDSQTDDATILAAIVN